MAVILSLPQFGQSIVEGTVSLWLKEEGDTVVRDEPLVTVSTEKIDTDLPAPEAGTVLRICVAPGTTVNVGTPLAYIGEPGEVLPEPSELGSTAAPAKSVPLASKSHHGLSNSSSAHGAGASFLSPVVARMLQEQGLSPAEVVGTGRDGRITRKDVKAAIAAMQNESEIPTALPGIQPLTPMRQAIAEHMTRSVQTSPHVTTFFEVDMGAVVQHRAHLQASLAQEGVSLSLLPFFMWAAVQALQEHPQVNSSLQTEGIALHQAVHLGIAVSVPHGLVVPVIRHADRLDLKGLAQTLTEMTTKARTRKLRDTDMKGSTFCITNHGALGSLAGTPIIHQPNAAILGVGAVVKRPVVRSSGTLLPQADDAIVIRPMCILSISFDHRILDGAIADGFLSHMRGTLEHWR